jgi:hypothetical protein
MAERRGALTRSTTGESVCSTTSSGVTRHHAPGQFPGRRCSGTDTRRLLNCHAATTTASPASSASSSRVGRQKTPALESFGSAARLRPNRIARVIAVDALVHKRFYPAQRKSVLLLCRASLICLYRAVAWAITAASFVKPYDPRLRTRIMADMRAVPPSVGRAALCSLLAWNRDAAIHQTAVPITVIPAAGMDDPADGESLATRCDIGRRLPGGHFAFMEAPKETARIIAECLAT